MKRNIDIIEGSGSAPMVVSLTNFSYRLFGSPIAEERSHLLEQAYQVLFDSEIGGTLMRPLKELNSIDFSYLNNERDIQSEAKSYYLEVEQQLELAKNKSGKDYSLLIDINLSNKLSGRSVAVVGKECCKKEIFNAVVKNIEMQELQVLDSCRDVGRGLLEAIGRKDRGSYALQICLSMELILDVTQINDFCDTLARKLIVESVALSGGFLGRLNNHDFRGK